MNKEPQTEASDKVSVWLKNLTGDTSISNWTTSVLLELCRVESFIQNDIDTLRETEIACFDIISTQLRAMVGETHDFKLCPIRKEIEQDDYYTFPAYSDHENIYAKRFNLVVEPVSGTYPWFLNSHVDVVPPYYPPESRNGLVFGRGSNDNKGGVVLSLLVVKLLQLWKEKTGEDITGQVGLSFSIDEEIGGNGSLSMIYDVDLKAKSVVVLEPTKLKPHPANRGALWIQVSLDLLNDKQAAKQHLLMLAVVRKLFALALDIRKKYPHRLFDDSDVQICMGMIDGFGKFPASACTETSFLLQKSDRYTVNQLQKAGHDFLVNHELLNAYANVPSEDDHFYLSEVREAYYSVKVSAKGGHMGSKDRGVDAIIKTAFLIRFFESEMNLKTVWIDGENRIKLEGGQGFLPSTNIKHIGELIRDAANQAKSEFTTEHKLSETDFDLKVSYDKIHNEAYCSADKAPGVECIIEALKSTGFGDKATNVSGWQASCDARIFARDCNDVTTFGAGALELAHGPDESVMIKDIVSAASILFTAIYSRYKGHE